MKRIVQKEITACDLCECEVEYENQCFRCGKDLCRACLKDPQKTVSYAHGVRCTGHGDGIYCKACDDELRNSKSDALHAAYVEMTNLNEAIKQHDEAIRKRATVESTIRRLFQLRKCGQLQ